MATTAGLRPRDCSNPMPFMPEPSLSSLSRCVPRSKPNSSRRRQRSPPAKQPAMKHPATEEKKLVMGEVRILKRGENLSPNSSQEMKTKPRSRSVRFEEVEKSKEDVILSSTERLGPDPKVVREKVVVKVKKDVDRFAANLWVTSPPPSQVPMPSIIPLKKVEKTCDAASAELLKMIGIVRSGLV